MIKAEGGSRKAEGRGRKTEGVQFALLRFCIYFLLPPSAFLLPFAAVSQAYPAKPVRMVIPIGPGSSMDITGRIVAQRLSETWSQTVIADNRVG